MIYMIDDNDNTKQIIINNVKNFIINNQYNVIE